MLFQQSAQFGVLRSQGSLCVSHTAIIVDREDARQAMRPGCREHPWCRAGTWLGELMNRKGHSSTKAAMVYLHASDEHDQQAPALGSEEAERVTGVEPALSAWESVPSGALMCPELRGWLSASARD